VKKRVCVYLACTAVYIKTLSHRCNYLESILYIYEAFGLAAFSSTIGDVKISAKNTIG